MRKAKAQEHSFLGSFPLKDRLASYTVFGSWSPAVWKTSDGYGARILVGSKAGARGTRMDWDYFGFDREGTVVQSPRGMAKQFNGKVRFVDMDRAVEEYKAKRVNE